MSKIKDIITNISKVSFGTWSRLIALIVSMITISLRTLGINIIPIADEKISLIATIVFAVICALAAYWKNNSFTAAAQEADRVLHGTADGRRPINEIPVMTCDLFDFDKEKNNIEEN